MSLCKAFYGKVVDIQLRHLTGYCVQVRNRESSPDTIKIMVESLGDVGYGDWVTVEGDRLTLGTSSSDRTNQLFDDFTSFKRKHNLFVRHEVEQKIRDFFLKEGFLEVRTPYFVQSPGIEAHIRPFEVVGAHYHGYLPTSPEFAMKVLLAGGHERIFQIASAFRDEPPSVMHTPEFTMCEWYRSFEPLETIMQDMERLVSYIGQHLGQDAIMFQGKKIHFTAPWKRLSVSDLFMERCRLDLNTLCDEDALYDAAYEKKLLDKSWISKKWDDVFFYLWLNYIEPKLPDDAFVFIVDYPALLAANAVLHPYKGTALRFEVFAGGLELANAFQELTDPHIQYERYESQMKLRSAAYGELWKKTPYSAQFHKALSEGLPPCSGVALGVDRLIMLFADASHIRETLWIEPGT